MQFKKNFLFFAIMPLIILFVGASYYRFMILHDYTVSYEGECEPSLDVCFIGCTNDECTENYYYDKVQKLATAVFKECGLDITKCKNAQICLPDESGCKITYCDPDTDNDLCETITRNINSDSVSDTSKNEFDTPTQLTASSTNNNEAI